MEAEAKLPELKPASIEILAALDQHGGTATSTEVRKMTSLDDTDSVNYRVRETLVPNGLVTSHQPEGRPLPPKELSITDRGQEALEAQEEERELNRDIAERLDRLEGRVESLQAENHDLREENQELREQIAELETGGGTPAGDVDDVDGLQKQVTKLANEVEDLKDDPIFDESIRAEIDDLRSGIYAVTQFIVDEFDAKDEIDELDAEISESIDPLSDQSK